MMLSNICTATVSSGMLCIRFWAHVLDKRFVRTDNWSEHKCGPNHCVLFTTSQIKSLHECTSRYCVCINPHISICFCLVLDNGINIVCPWNYAHWYALLQCFMIIIVCVCVFVCYLQVQHKWLTLKRVKPLCRTRYVQCRTMPAAVQRCQVSFFELMVIN